MARSTRGCRARVHRLRRLERRSASHSRQQYSSVLWQLNDQHLDHQNLRRSATSYPALQLERLCWKTELTDNKDADADVAFERFQVGDNVKTYILKLTDCRIALGLKPSHFGDAGSVEDEEAEDDGEEEQEVIIRDVDAESSDEEDEGMQSQDQAGCDESEVGDVQEHDEDVDDPLEGLILATNVTSARTSTRKASSAPLLSCGVLGMLCCPKSTF